MSYAICALVDYTLMLLPFFKLKKTISCLVCFPKNWKFGEERKTGGCKSKLSGNKNVSRNGYVALIKIIICTAEYLFLDFYNNKMIVLVLNGLFLYNWTCVHVVIWLLCVIIVTILSRMYMCIWYCKMIFDIWGNLLVDWYKWKLSESNILMAATRNASTYWYHTLELWYAKYMYRTALPCWIRGLLFEVHKHKH